MAKTIKELAKELNCSYEAVRKQVKRYGKELQDHIYLQHKTQFLDDYACDFLRDKRMDSPVVVSRMEYDEAVEHLKTKYTQLLEKHNELQEEHRALIDAKNGQLARLEADNKVARAEVAEAKKDAQEAQEGLVRAQEAYEKDLRKKNAQIEVWEKYAADLQQYLVEEQKYHEAEVTYQKRWFKKKKDKPVPPILPVPPAVPELQEED